MKNQISGTGVSIGEKASGTAVFRSSASFWASGQTHLLDRSDLEAGLMAAVPTRPIRATPRFYLPMWGLAIGRWLGVVVAEVPPPSFTSPELGCCCVKVEVAVLDFPP